MSRAVAAAAIAILLLCAVPGPGHAQHPAEGGDYEDIEKVDYAVDIDGEMPAELRSVIDQSSQLLRLSDKPPASLLGLQRRAEGDVGRFKQVLQSRGYYDSDISFEIKDDKDPPVVNIVIEPGPAYRLSDYTVTYQGLDDPSGLPQSGGDLGLEIGTQAEAKRIVSAQGSLLEILKQRGYPFSEVTDRRAVVNHEKQTLRVTLAVDPGPEVAFGEMELNGLESVEESYIRDFRTWQPGETYDSRKIDLLRTDLRETGLFNSVLIDHADSPDDQGQVPVQVSVEERPHRSIGGGGGWSTDLGFEANVFWEHRNFFGRDEDLRLELEGSRDEQRASADLTKPRFLRPDQQLLINTALSNEITDAFDRLALEGTTSIRRQLSDAWSVRLGVAGELEQIRENGEDKEFLLLGLPASVQRDTRDNILDPTEGSNAQLSITPYANFVTDSQGFVVSEFRGSAYYAIDDDGWYVLAGRTRVGSILGGETLDLPANKRFFAGGGGSVRGYEFQKLGPLDGGGDPTGGRSVIEVGAELRLRLTETIGIVPFIEGGTVFDDYTFTGANDNRIRWAAGLGLRYFTPIGPIRLDFAVPLDKRDGDDNFQFYISIGQAF